MALTKKRYATLNKFLTDIKKRFKNVKWEVYQPTDYITEVYGKGFILRGTMGIFEKEFFILIEDPRRLEWAAMINGELESEVKNAHGSR